MCTVRSVAVVGKALYTGCHYTTHIPADAHHLGGTNPKNTGTLRDHRWIGTEGTLRDHRWPGDEGMVKIVYIYTYIVWPIL